MPIVYILIGLAALGCLLWFVNNKLNIDANFKWWINVIIIGCLVLWVLRESGILPALLSIRV